MSRTDVVQAQRTVALVLAIALFVMLVADHAVLWTLKRVQFRSGQSTSGQLQRRILVESFMTGMFASQLLLAVAYSALGDGSSLKRIVCTTFALAVFTNSLIFMNVPRYGPEWGSATLGGFLVPMAIFYWLQIPLWGIRGWFRWSIRSPWSELSQTRHLRFSLAQMFVWSVFVAVPLGILKITTTSSEAFANFDFMFGICLWTIIGCFFLIWLLRIALAPALGKWKWLAAIGLPVLVVIVMQLSLDLWQSGRMNLNSTMFRVTAVSSAGLVMVLCLQLAHRIGFRFVRSA